jgi:hypothetical protein
MSCDWIDWIDWLSTEHEDLYIQYILRKYICIYRSSSLFVCLFVILRPAGTSIKYMTLLGRAGLERQHFLHNLYT